ncbi:hypothetical protein WN943_012112 [Citrus x changshan-huyou]
MGEDLFRAIQGGGIGASFGVIVAWKVRLVIVPSTVTRFRVSRSLEQNATKIVHKWQPLDLLVDRNSRTNGVAGDAATNGFFKSKSDYVKQPIPENAFEGIYDNFYEEDGETAFMLLVPYGGKMSEISESETPYPHRAGNIYQILYAVTWGEDETSQSHIDWIRRLYSHRTPYVSENPREAYINYRDLDIGTNNQGHTSIKQASIWGNKYFKNNFKRLVHVKTMVDPYDFFKNEQSIPPLTSWRKKNGD